MPKNTRYKWSTTQKGGKTRLAFSDNKIVEVKKKTGKFKLTSAGKRLMGAL